METYQSKERVLAVQVESIEKYTVNGEIELDPTFVSQHHIRQNAWLVSNGAEFTDVMSDSAFNALYELDTEESVEEIVDETQEGSDETQEGSEDGDGDDD